MKKLFDTSSYECSKLITNAYSTSFSLGIKLFNPSIRQAIYAIYGFVRYADEIVDSFHKYNQKEILTEFIEEYQKAIKRKISINPIINSFQEVSHKYELYDYTEGFLERMKMDLDKKDYNTKEEYENYIYGSANVVGLMCLRVFVNNDSVKFNNLKHSATKLGSAFQKVNFLRDLRQDTEELGRSYFPNLKKNAFSNEIKKDIVLDIEKDFKEAYSGIIKLPVGSRLGVYVAYKYYLNLLKKLKKTEAKKILKQRIRISNPKKVLILTKAYIRFKTNIT